MSGEISSMRRAIWPRTIGAPIASAVRARRTELRHLLPQVVAGEGEVARLLGDVDLHDALQQRVERRAAAERGALHVVDRVLAAEHEDEEQLREAARDGATTRRAPSRGHQARPGTSKPVRFTNSWNISECCASSMTSW